MPTTKPDTDTGWTKLVIMDTDRGSEVWPDAAGSELTAIFTQRADADFFVAAVSGSQFHNDKIRNAAFNIASAFPDLNYSDQPINPNGELVGRIAQIIQADFPLTSLSPSDVEQLIRLREKAMRFVLDPDNQDCYHDSFHSTSADWPPEFLHLCDAVVEHCAHTYEHKDREPTEDPNGYCTVPGCEQPLEHWIHLGTSERDEFLKDRAALAHIGGES